MTLVDYERKRVFFLSEKCASTSIRDRLLELGWKRIQQEPKDEWPTFTYYGVIRNPYERAVSYWAYRKKTGDTDLDFKGFVLKGGLVGFKTLAEWFEDVELDIQIAYWDFENQFQECMGFVLMQRLKAIGWYQGWADTLEEYYANKSVMSIVTAWALPDIEKYGFGNEESET